MDCGWVSVFFCYNVSANATAGGSRLGKTRFEMRNHKHSVHVELDSVTSAG